MTISRITPHEIKRIEALKLWLDSLDDMLLLSQRAAEPELAAKVEVPAWVRECSARLEVTLFAEVNTKLAESVFSPYRVGYAVGLMRWGAAEWHAPLPLSVVRMAKKQRLSSIAKRRIGKLIQTFALKHDLPRSRVFHVSKYIPANHRDRLRQLDKYAGADSAEYHRGLSAGLRGIGDGTPGDRSNLATNVYLTLLMWWRIIVRFQSVTELHRWLTMALGAQQVGERKRIEKICERIGLKFRDKGRPVINPTLALPG